MKILLNKLVVCTKQAQQERLLIAYILQSYGMLMFSLYKIYQQYMRSNGYLCLYHHICVVMRRPLDGSRSIVPPPAPSDATTSYSRRDAPASSQYTPVSVSSANSRRFSGLCCDAFGGGGGGCNRCKCSCCCCCRTATVLYWWPMNAHEVRADLLDEL